MTRPKWLPLALLGVAAVLLAAVLALLQAQRSDETPAAAPFCPFAAAAIDRVTYVLDGDTVSLTRDSASAWSLTDDPALPLAQGTVQQMVNDLAALTAASTLGPEADTAAMGFDAPTAAVTLAAGGEAYAFTVGAVNTMTGSYYLRPAGGETVYTVDSAAFSGLCRSRRGLYAAQTLNDLDAGNLTAMTVDTGAETLEFVHSGGQWALADDPGFALDQDRVQRMANTACGLQTAWTVTEPAADSAYGLDTPDVTVTVTDGQTSWSARFGADAGPDGATCYLAAGDKPSLVYEVLRQHREAFACTKEALAAPDDELES